jgi:hypothetical protein
MAFAGAATGAPAQSEQQSLTDPVQGTLTGSKLQLKKMGIGRMVAVAPKAVEKNPYKAVLQSQLKGKLLAASTSRSVPKVKSSTALSYKAPNALNSSATALADQPVATKHASVLSKTGVNAWQQETFGGYNLEPPDPAVCAGQGFVVQVVNNQIQISDGNLNHLTAPIPNEAFFGDFLNAIFDPQCAYNHSTGRWYYTLAVSDFASFSGVYIAVSTSSDPRGPWNLYFLDLTSFGGDGACAVSGCLADQPNLGADQYTISISTNQFDLDLDGDPLTGCASGFCGAAYVLIDKVALALGNPFPGTVAFDISNSPTILPDFNFGSCIDGFGPCWYSIQPAESANGRYDTRSGGTQWAMSALDFFGISDSRVALWRFANTQSIGAFVPAISGTAAILHMPSHETYSNPPFAAQPQNQTSPIQGNGNPLGDFLVLAGFCSAGTPPDGCSNPGPIQTNDDRMQMTMMTTLATGQRIMWGGLTTDAGGNAGILMFGVNLGSSAASSSLVRTWGIHNPSVDVYFPAVSIFDNGIALASYTASGPGLYASSAYSVFSTSMAPDAIRIANRGLGVQDGFTQYGCIDAVPWCGGFWRPRWGDYSGAATMGNSIYFTAEYIPDANCSLLIFKDFDDTCGPSTGGGTSDTPPVPFANKRTFFANWGTSLDRATLTH